MTGHSVGKVLRSVTLTLGAVVGSVCLLWTVGLGVAGIRPLVFLSGSMSPTIAAGDVGFARTVDADTVAVGDIVSLNTGSGSRVTHRVVAATPDGTSTTLRLQGDANDSMDAQPYTVTEVDRVFGHVPGLGHVILAASSPWGMAASAGLLVACLVLVVRGRRDGEDENSAPLPRRPLTHHVGILALVLAMLVGAVIAPATGTLAYFSDSPKLSTPVNGLDAARWFTCAQSMSSASYGSQPWAHLNFDENTGAPQTSATDPYFKSTTDPRWDGIYFTGSAWNGQTPSVGHGQACRRDTASRSVYLQGTVLTDAQFVRIETQSQNENGATGVRWNNFTVNVWFKTNVTASDDKAGVLASFSQAGGIEAAATDRVMYLDSSGRLTFEVYPGAHRFRNSTGSYADNAWHMATMTLGPAGQCLFVDGAAAQACNTAVTSAYQSSTGTFWRFGYGHLSNGFQGITDGDVPQRIFKGYIDDGAIWTRQLTATEVLHMYRAGLPLLG